MLLLRSGGGGDSRVGLISASGPGEECRCRFVFRALALFPVGGLRCAFLYWGRWFDAVAAKRWGRRLPNLRYEEITTAPSTRSPTVAPGSGTGSAASTSRSGPPSTCTCSK